MRDVEARLDRLERSVRRWRLGCAVAVAAAVAMGAASDGQDLTVRSLTVIDRAGKTVARLGEGPQGGRLAQFYDAQGVPRVTVGVDSTKQPCVAIQAPDQVNRVMMVTEDDGSPSVAFCDRGGSDRLCIGLRGANDSPYVEHFDKAGRGRYLLNPLTSASR